MGDNSYIAKARQKISASSGGSRRRSPTPCTSFRNHDLCRTDMPQNIKSDASTPPRDVKPAKRPLDDAQSPSPKRGGISRWSDAEQYRGLLFAVSRNNVKLSAEDQQELAKLLGRTPSAVQLSERERA